MCISEQQIGICKTNYVTNLYGATQIHMILIGNRPNDRMALAMENGMILEDPFDILEIIIEVYIAMDGKKTPNTENCRIGD